MNTNYRHSQGSFASRHGGKALRIVGLTFAGVGFAVLFAFLFGLVVKVLWNWLMPAIFGLGMITFWQAFGIVLLAKLLFSGFTHSHRHDDSRMERRFKDRFKRFSGAKAAEDENGFPPGDARKWRHFRQYWKDEGRAAFESYIQRMHDQEEEEEKGHQE
jgi:hypothetical protein